MSEESTSSSAQHNITKTFTHEGRYIRYVLENQSNLIFEVSKKYDPLLRYISRGYYGVVCAATNSETKKDVAIKKIGKVFDRKIHSESRSRDIITLSQRTLREIMILKNLSHENLGFFVIVAIKDVIPPPQEEFNDVYIVYDLMDMSFDELIYKKQKSVDGQEIYSYQLKDEDCQNYLYQLLRGLKYAHSACVLHRDLCPSNLLLNTSTKVLKIADFGLARIKSNTDPMTEDVGARQYRAPELLLHGSNYTEAIDIWSVGCIFVEMVTRKPLFPAKSSGKKNLKSIVELVGSPDDSSLNGFPDNRGTVKCVKELVEKKIPTKNFAEEFPCMSKDAIDLLKKILVFDAKKRISVDDALGHDYFEKYHDIRTETVSEMPLDINFERSMNNIDIKDIKEEIRRQSQFFNP